MPFMWKREQPLADGYGPFEFVCKYGDWRARVEFTESRCVEEWIILVWNPKTPNVEGIDSMYDDYAGYLTAADAMRACEQWLVENAKSSSVR